MMIKEKLLVSSNFSFSHNVFQSYISFMCQNAVLCCNGLTSTKISAVKVRGRPRRNVWNVVSLGSLPSGYIEKEFKCLGIPQSH